MNEKPNVILVSLDTLRADVAFGGSLRNLTAISNKGIVFRNTVSSAPITPVSHASVFTGMQPYEHGIRHLFRETLMTSERTLAEILADDGYVTGAVVSCPGLDRWYGLNRGFHHYDDEIPLLSDGSDPLNTVDVKKRGTALKRAPLVVQRATEWLAGNRETPFFLFVHFFDTHWPYDPPEWFAADGANPYEAEALYIDFYLGRLFEEITASGLMDNTLIVIFGDHGEDLAGWYANDHGGNDMGYPEEEGHGCLLFDCTQMVPLIFVFPDIISAGKSVDVQVRLVDIFPTVLDLLGIDDDSSRSGRSLRNLLVGGREPHQVAYCETLYREEQNNIPDLGGWKALRIANRYKIIFDLSTQKFIFFDLAADPNEHRPIIMG